MKTVKIIKKGKKRISSIALLLIIALAFSACGNKANASNAKASNSDVSNSEVSETEAALQQTESTDETFTIRVGVCSGDQNQYLKILDDHTGFLKDKGIDMEVTEFAAGINTIDAIVTDQLDVGLFADYAGVNRIGNTLDDTELRAFVNVATSNAWNLYVNPEHIKTADDLYNAVLISQAGVVFEYDYGKLFEKYGIDSSKVNIQNVGSVQEALALAAAGTGDAFWANTQTAPMFEEYGWEPFVNVADIDATMYTYLVANDSYLTEHQAEVVRFLKASEEGFQYITDHLDEVSKWISEDTGLDQQLVISGWKSAQYDYTFSQEAYEDLKKVEEWCYKNGNFDTDYDVSKYINTDALAKVDPDKVTYKAE